MRWTCIARVALIVVAGCGIEGINNANPSTVLRVDPSSRAVEFRDNKDNDVMLKGFKASTPSGASASIDELTLHNNASAVREANYVQMQGMALQATANWQGAAAMVQSLGAALAEVMPYVPASIAARALGKLRSGATLGLPNGISLSTGGALPAQLDALLSIAGTKSSVASSQPFTEPIP